MLIRKATVEDIDLIIKLRLDFIADEKGPIRAEEQEDLRQRLKEYLEKWMPGGGFTAFFAEENGEVLSTAFLSIAERPPRTAFSSYAVGTVYNVFTYAGHRRRGIAAKVMTALLEEAGALGVGYVDLLATRDGKPLYEKLGFNLTEYASMRKNLIRQTPAPKGNDS